jgi:acyl carrier protein
MIPSHFVKLKSFPLTQSGKVNKRALPEPPAVRPHLNQIYVSPITEKEKRVADLWATHLNLDKVGLHDNFFDLGGNSILATAVIEAIGKDFNIPLSVITLFQFPTIAALVNHINTNGSEITGIAAETQNRINKQRNSLSNQKWFKKK